MRPATNANDIEKIALTRRKEPRRFLFWSYAAEIFEELPRQEAMSVWAAAFLDNIYPMIVVHPAFDDYSPQYNQVYAYMTAKDIRTSAGFAKTEKAFFLHILEDQTRFDPATAAYIPRGFYGENGNLKPFDAMAAALQFLPKKEILAQVVPELQKNLQCTESGIYCPGQEPGLFLLSSV